MATIVWIEDDIDVIGDVVLPIKRAGHEIVTYENVAEALDHIQELKAADLILLDVLLPPGPGREKENDGQFPGVRLLEILREEKGVETPVLMFTVIQGEDLQNGISKYGVNVINKPILPQTLKRYVEDMLEKHKKEG